MAGLGVLIALILLVMFGIPIGLFIAGLARRRTNPDSAKRFMIIAVVWLIVGLGACVTMLNA